MQYLRNTCIQINVPERSEIISQFHVYMTEVMHNYIDDSYSRIQFVKMTLVIN